ncbi:hypothetical protein ACFPOA_10190 [Lysobacter niabensis]|uniref:hypothetical protein n=1 Tax=Agrilutibacter niabensis TaxID=380628 RepID=UPI00360E7579
MVLKQQRLFDKDEKMRKDISVKSSHVVASLLMALALRSTNANATGIPVVDIPHTIQSTLNQINTYSQRFQDAYEYGENAARWTSTLSHYRQQLVRINGIVMGFGLPRGQVVSRVDANYLVAERCGLGLGFGSPSQVFRPDGSGNIVEQQKRICANIQRMQNAKYNYTIEFFQEYMPKLEGELDRLGSQRNSSNDEGNVAASDNDALRIGNEAEAKFQAWQANIQAYDSYVAAMEGNQRLLARMAMKGRESALGAMVRTTALKDALEVGE